MKKLQYLQKQFALEDIELNIYGYQLKYSKTGFTSADMAYLKIYQNSTMFILVNGFTNPDNEQLNSNLGVEYELVNKTDVRTGTIVDNENQTKNVGSESSSIIRAKNADGLDLMIVAEESATEENDKVVNFK